MKNSLIELLEQLEMVITEAPRVPLTDKVILDANLLLDLLDQVRYSLPDEFHRAKQIESERDRLISASQKDADKIIRQAEEYARKLIDQHEIMQAAKGEAQNLRKEAEMQAEELCQGADKYADSTLTELADLLQQTLAVIEKGRQKLRAEQVDNRTEH